MTAIVQLLPDAPRAPLRSPNGNGYLLLAVTVDRRPSVLPSSRRKRALIAAVADAIAGVARLPQVTQADLFEAQLVAPGTGTQLLRRRSNAVTPARFDLVLLIETRDPAAAREVRDDSTYRALARRLIAESRHSHEVVARNVRRIADVDHTRPAVFLFNFFYADDPAKLLPVFEYTAGWFVENTALPDSTVLEPLAGEPAEYGIINHASWPHFRTFLPHLVLRPSFRRFVLATFAANGIAAQPILYRRAQTHPATVKAVTR
jgi:hypothetical protein